MTDIENPMAIGNPYPDEFDKPVGKCKVCKSEVGHGQGAAVYDIDILVCTPACLWRYLVNENILEEL